MGHVNVKAHDDKWLQFELPHSVSSAAVLKQLAHMNAKEWALVDKGTREAVCAGAIADALIEYNSKLPKQESGASSAVGQGPER